MPLLKIFKVHVYLFTGSFLYSSSALTSDFSNSFLFRIYTNMETGIKFSLGNNIFLYVIKKNGFVNLNFHKFMSYEGNAKLYHTKEIYSLIKPPYENLLKFLPDISNYCLIADVAGPKVWDLGFGVSAKVKIHPLYLSNDGPAMELLGLRNNFEQINSTKYLNPNMNSNILENPGLKTLSFSDAKRNFTLDYKNIDEMLSQIVEIQAAIENSAGISKQLTDESNDTCDPPGYVLKRTDIEELGEDMFKLICGELSKTIIDAAMKCDACETNEPRPMFHNCNLVPEFRFASALNLNELHEKLQPLRSKIRELYAIVAVQEFTGGDW